MPPITDSRASSGSLTSCSPSPPPASSRKNPSAKPTGLDSSSELSELTEDEQEPSRSEILAGSPRKDGRRVPRRKRSGIVPEPMWNWAYKSNDRKQQNDDPDDDDNASSASTRSKRTKSAPASAKDTPIIEDEEDELDGPGVKAATEPLHGGSSTLPKINGGESSMLVDSPLDNDDASDAQDAPPLPPAKDTDHESSPALTEDEDAHDHESDYSRESEEDLPDDNEDDNEEAPEDEEDADESAEQQKIVDTAPVVPVAPAGSSIMAGQQLIKTPSASPSTSPEPEEDRDENETPQLDKVVKDEPVEPAAVADDTEMGARADLDADPDAEVEAEAETEETDLDLQPAHRAEALDVLAQIEFRFALLREALYVEKMEELALEEAMIMQGIHPEMIHLQAELKVRHDRRLDLAAKRRKLEDKHVTLMRTVEENSTWSWWKHERDELGTEMFAETNRKRRKLEREKRILERPSPTICMVPPGPAVPAKTISVNELFRLASLDTVPEHASQKRKRKDTVDDPNDYPALTTLNAQEIQSDLRLLTAPRSRAYPPMPGEIGPGIAMPPAPQYVDYNGPPGRAPYHPQPLHAPPPPPMASIHHPGARSMQGPGAPPPPPPSSSAYSNHGYPRPLRRSTSPFDGGQPVNGNTIYSAMNGPGQHWAQVPGPVSSAGAGPSKQSAMNGYGKEGRRDGREREKIDRERERERLWLEGNMKEQQMQDELSRVHNQHMPRNSFVHQPQQQGVPHHHHHIHRHNGHHGHHHHPSSQRPPSQIAPGRGPNDIDLDNRYGGPFDQRNHHQKIHSESPYWKHEEERERERERDRRVAHQAPMNQLGPAPDRERERERDRPPSTPFVMTPSQAVQAGFNGPGPNEENEQWMDEQTRYERDREREQEREHVERDGERYPLEVRRPHIGPTHSRQASNSTSIRSPRSRSGKFPLTHSPSSTHPLPPPASGPGMGPVPAPPFGTLLHSPARLSQSLAASPRTSSIAQSNSNPDRERDRSASGSGASGVSPPQKGTRTISPLPLAKSLPTVYTGTPAGPGTPGSRLGTPALAGPGTRPSSDLSPPALNGHVHGGHGNGLGITHGPGLYPGPGVAGSREGLAGPAHPAPPGAENGPGHMAPPKMTAVPLGHGS